MRRAPPPFLLLFVGLVMLIVVFAVLLSITFQQNQGDIIPPVTVAAAAPIAEATSEPIAAISADNHAVAAGETLSMIAERYGVTLAALVSANNIADPDHVEVDTLLIIPSQPIVQSDPSINENQIPDSERVFGPSMQSVDILTLVPSNSYLWQMSETVEGVSLNGVEIVRLVAERTRVNPRLLLAALDYRSGWVSGQNPVVTDKPMGYTYLVGLYPQLEWTANLLNLGYYSRSEAGLAQLQLVDGTPIAIDPNLNAGMVGVHMWLAQQPDVTFAKWQADAGSDGFFASYRQLFGDPFAYVSEVMPSGLVQPLLTLPWEAGEVWHFSGGPHGGWISGSAWAALDFIPGGEQLGCYVAPQWVTAMADGVVVRSDFGGVVLDLDGDGYAGTGWTILYQHIAPQQRVAVGTRLQRGDRIGHPSCEGGYSTGTHLHVARMFNGRWISADSESLPFTLSGWVASGSGSEYNGILTRGNISIAAEAARDETNEIVNQ